MKSALDPPAILSQAPRIGARLNVIYRGVGQDIGCLRSVSAAQYPDVTRTRMIPRNLILTRPSRAATTKVTILRAPLGCWRLVHRDRKICFRVLPTYYPHLREPRRAVIMPIRKESLGGYGGSGTVSNQPRHLSFCTTIHSPIISTRRTLRFGIVDVLHLPWHFD